MNTQILLGSITEQLEQIRHLSAETKLRISKMNWKIARDMWNYQQASGLSATEGVVSFLKKSGEPDDRGGASGSKLSKLVVIGRFSEDDLEKLGIPNVDPFVFLQHKARFVDPKTKLLLNTDEARNIVRMIKDGASDFLLRKITRKGTKY